MAKTTKSIQKPQSPKQFQRLMYLEGKVKQIFSHKYFRLPSFESLLLWDVQIDAFVTIAKIMVDRNTRKYLHHYGLRPDTEIKIASKTINDSVIIAMNDLRIGIGLAITHQEIVRMMPGQS